MSASVADLEITLRRTGLPGDAAGTPAQNTYAAELRYSAPDSQTDNRAGVDAPILITLDFASLLQQAGDPGAYSKALSDALYASADFRAEFTNMLHITQAGSADLRLRLLPDYAAPELHTVRWEALLDPERAAPLFTGDQVYFSRYLVSTDWRPVQLLSKGDLQALVAVAGPSDLESIGLSPIDGPKEVALAQAGLGQITTVILPVTPADRCTLARLDEVLRTGGPDGTGFDILYLVCHGAYIDGEPWIVLEDEQGKSDRLQATQLADRLNDMDNRPRLVVLASCQSAGNTAGLVFNALGPLLAKAGVPAVVAMQGSINQNTVAKFMPTFFSELVKDGQIDRAMAVARGAVRDCDDYWMPVLYMRLKNGRLWYVPGFSGDGAGFQKWASLVNNLKRGGCTPIIGPGITDTLVASTRDIATRLADQYSYPLERYDRDNLPQVAQFLAITQDENFPRDQVISTLRDQVVARHAAILPDALKGPGVDLNAVLDAVLQDRIARLAAQGRVEPHQFLASLPLPIYITTNFSNLLASALTAAGKTPQVVICPWNQYIVDSNTTTNLDPNYRPSASNPLVFHLFGRFDDPNSLVLTEDDYFDFLIGITRNQELVPSFVRSALAATSLLFVGFQLHEWDFRVLFRSINGQEGSGLRRRFVNVGVQVDVSVEVGQEGEEIIDPNGARSYLQKYFENAFISLYWGSTDDFLQELARQLKA